MALLIPGRALAGEPPELHQHFVRGDVNVDGSVQVADPITLLGYLFGGGGGSLPCRDAADANDDEALDLSDAIALLDYLFTGGELLPPPGGPGGCGPDPTLDVALSCGTYPPCDDQTTAEFAAHLLRRLGYGPTPERLAHVLEVGAPAYIFEQLHPELDDESDNWPLLFRLAQLTPDGDLVSLVDWQVVMALYGRNQLREALVDFWENHFNTYLPKLSSILSQVQVAGVPIYTPDGAVAEATSWEWRENTVFREAALGSFAELLVASATSPTMIVYLDGFANSVIAPNENYARELLELHTMGVDNGYTQADVEQVARCFTGWTVRKKAPQDAGDPLAPPVPLDDPAGVWAFHFEPFDHDYEAKVIFEGTPYELVIPPRPLYSVDGILDGFEVLSHVAGLQQTAEFVSGKLIQRFVSDAPPPSLLAASIATWLTTAGDLTEVIGGVLTSPEFSAPENRWNKLETPFENLVSALRAVEAETSGLPVIFGAGLPQTGLIGLDHIPFFLVTPDGQPEVGTEWLGSSALLDRTQFVHHALQSLDDPQTSPVLTLIGEGVALEDTEAVADFWLQRLFQSSYDLTERELAIDYLGRDASGTPAPLDAMAPDYGQRIRAFIAFLLSTPQGQTQ